MKKVKSESDYFSLSNVCLRPIQAIVQTVSLKLDSGFSKAEITDLFEALDMFKGIQPISAYELLRAEQQNGGPRNITTLSESFDRILGGLKLIILALILNSVSSDFRDFPGLLLFFVEIMSDKVI